MHSYKLKLKVNKLLFLQHILSCKVALAESTKLRSRWLHRLEKTGLSKVACGVELPLKFETKTGELHSVNNEQGDGRKTSQTFE